MRKFYSLLTFAVMMLVSLAANAWSFDLLEENTVLQSEAYNMRLYKNYNFYGGTYNGQPFTNDAGDEVKGDGCFTLSADKASFKVNGFDAFQVLAPAQMSNFYIQIGTSALNLRANVGKDGLHNYGSGSRFFAIGDVKAGQIIVCQWGITSSRASVVQPASALTGADVCTFEDITEEIHAAQNADLEEGAESVSDNFSYWRATSDGYFVVEMQRDAAIQGLQIWIDNSASEAVSSPIMSIASVNGTARGIDFKPGESTFGNPCASYYITEEDVENGIEYPVWLKDTEEVDHYEYTYQLDEEGNKILDEEGNPIVADSTAVYKKVLDYDMVAEVGQFGEHPYDPEIGLWIDQNSDVNGDGLVTIWACTLSEETGVYSNIVSLDVSVGEIVLNEPTLSLIGMSDVDRVYKINWTSNTLSGEPYTITVEGSGADSGYAEEFPENTGNGAVISFKEHVNITVSAPGYTSSTLSYDADLAGIKVSRANENPDVHDWDFVNISQDMYNQFTGNVVASYLEVVDNDTIARTIAEYEAQEEAGVDVSGWITVPAVYGWYQPIASNRTTLNVVEGGLDMNANGYGYVEEKTGIFHDLAISCPPNASNNSCILKYIDKTDGNELGALGVYFMSRPTITFPRSVAKAGQFVEIYYGQGGSNYTNNTTHQFYEVPADGLLSVTLPNGGVHVFYIDVHTYDNLPEDLLENAEQAWEEVVVIDDVKASKKVATYYTLSGAKLAAPAKGINIVKYADGTSKKVLVK